jgi:hypothetical protein
LVEAKNKKIPSSYVYGNVAFDLEQDIEPIIEKKINRQPKSENSHKFKLIGKIIVISILSFLLVYRFTIVMKDTYDIRSLQTQINATNGENENIRIDLANLNNIKTIESIAVGKRGMVIPDSSQIKYLSVKPLTLSSDKLSPSAFQMIQRLLGLIY